jgi:hypothetical protein
MLFFIICQANTINELASCVLLAQLVLSCCHKNSLVEHEKQESSASSFFYKDRARFFYLIFESVIAFSWLSRSPPPVLIDS